MNAEMRDCNSCDSHYCLRNQDQVDSFKAMLGRPPPLFYPVRYFVLMYVEIKSPMFTIIPVQTKKVERHSYFLIVYTDVLVFPQLGIHFIPAKSGLHKRYAHRRSCDNILTNCSLHKKGIPWYSHDVVRPC